MAAPGLAEIDARQQAGLRMANLHPVNHGFVGNAGLSLDIDGFQQRSIVPIDAVADCFETKHIALLVKRCSVCRHYFFLCLLAFLWRAGYSVCINLYTSNHRFAMGRKTEDEKAANDLLDRIRHLFERTWNRNQRRMAEAIGISQPTLSRVLSGTQKPGRSLLLALGTFPGIDIEWLLHGRGKAPFQDPVQLVLRSGFLPVSTRLLPGAPGDYPHQLTGDYAPAAEQFNRPSCYWLRVCEHHFAEPLHDHDLRQDDLLLLETSWGDLPSLPEIVLVRDTSTGTLLLVRSNGINTQLDREAFFRRHGQYPRNVNAEMGAADERAAPDDSTGQQNIVAVGLQVVRRLWG